MIVYGDPQYGCKSTHALRVLSRLAEDADSLDALRDLLIATGQFEQAICDAENVPADFVTAAMRLTDLAATVFHACCVDATIGEDFSSELYGHKGTRENRAGFLRVAPLPSPLLARSSRREGFSQYVELLGQPWPEMALTIKVPEGFAFYGLFPEQYVLAGSKWAEANASSLKKEVLVVGMRSIGTSLSALVAVTLQALGWRTQRIAVRPSGDPFARSATLPECDHTARAVVVDEGPGASGSSMVAAAEALIARGIKRERIAFLPGHSGEPGSAASESVRNWWQTTPRFTSPLADVRWQGCSIKQSLALKAGEICGTSEPFETIDLSGGLWRKIIFANESEWPAVAVQFERLKFLCRTDSGLAVLWKFSGLGPDLTFSCSSAVAQFQEMLRRAERTGSPRPRATHRGFVAMPWVSGTRLTEEDADSIVLGEIVDYLVRSFRGFENEQSYPLHPSEAEAAFGRLKHMLYWNCRKALGESVAYRVQRRIDAFTPPRGMPAYTDGHMAPYEWVRTASGAIIKTDVTGHDCDHTLIGRQPCCWDIAGVLVEWNLDEEKTSLFLEALTRRGLECSEEVTDFYCLAYAAFRLGLMIMAVNATVDAAERSRLERAAAVYRKQVFRRC